MYGNFEWQKQLANERVQTAVQEADEHRRSQRWYRKSFARTVVKQIILGGAGLVLIGVLISGCTPVSPAILGEVHLEESQNEASAGDANFPLPYSLDDLSRYYAKFRVITDAEAGPLLPSSAENSWSITDRIYFHDRLQKGAPPPADLPETVRPPGLWSMAARIRFHDRLEDGEQSLDELDMKDIGNLQRWQLEDRY